MASLNERERRFVSAYLTTCNGNATKAAITAGYAESGAGVQGNRLLKRAHVQAAITQKLDKADLRTEAILARLGRLVHAEPDRISGADINTAARTILQVNGALKDKQSDSRITVNIGFLSNSTKPTVTVSEEVFDATTNTVVMPAESVVMPPIAQLTDSEGDT